MSQVRPVPKGKTMVSLIGASQHPVQDLGSARGSVKAAERKMKSLAHP